MKPDVGRKSPMSRHGRNTQSGEETQPKTTLEPSYDFDGLLSTERQMEIKTSTTLPALPSTANNFYEVGWIDLAICKGKTYQFFRHSCSKRCDAHPDGCTRVKSVRVCRSMCAECPVLEHCRIWAVQKNLAHGFAGGLTESERARLRKAFGIEGEEDE